MDVIKKAFKVYHDGMINENPYEGYTFDTLPITYAKSPGEAKKLAIAPYDYALNDDDPKFIDLKVRRAPKADIVIFEGVEKTIYQVEQIIKRRELVLKRKEAVEKYPDGTYFYVQNGYVGNSVLWWGKDSRGYTTDISKAEMYSKAEILARFVDGRDEDIIWEAKHVNQHIKQHVDGQYLSKEFCC